MAVKVSSGDISKSSWQSKRPPELKGCGLGKALDAWESHGSKDADKVFDSGKGDDALALSVAVTRALGVAKKKASKLGKDKKTDADATIEAYEKYVSTWTDELLTLMKKEADRKEKANKELKKQLDAIQALTLENVLANAEYSKRFLAQLKKEYSHNELEFWQAAQKKKTMEVAKLYVGPDAKNEVNLPSNIVKEFLEAMNEDKIAKAPWSKAIADIRGMLSSDPLTRFKNAEKKAIMPS